jgi:hypothetical protein
MWKRAGFHRVKGNGVWKEMTFILNTTRKDSELGFEVNIKPND